MSKLPKYLGYSLEKLSAPWKSALETYSKNGAVKKVGEIESIEIKSRAGESPVHKSAFNPKDKEDVLSVRIKPVDKSRGTFTHHVYSDGKGTFKMGDKREYSTGAGRRE